MKHLNKNILFVALALIILIGISTKGFSNLGGMSLSGKNAANIAIEYIKEQIHSFEPNAEIKLVSHSQEYGVTKVVFSIDGQESIAYISNDGKVLFPEAIIIDKKELLKDIPKASDPEIKLFTMSFCPYGNQAEDLVIKTLAEFDKPIKVRPHYVTYSNYPSPEVYHDYCFDENAEFCSLQGLVEIKQNIREMCIYKYNQELFWDYLNKVNNQCNIENIENCWKEPALKLDIDITKIEKCFNEEAMDILAAEKEIAEKYNAKSSPTLLINGIEYAGERTVEGYKAAFCAGFKNPPKECRQ